MADDDKDPSTGEGRPREGDEPRINDKRKIDPETFEARSTEEPAVDEEPEGLEDVELVQAEGPDVETVSDEDLVEFLAEGERDLVAEYRDRAARAEAELKNFRTRVERDRAANREIVIAEVIRSLLPAIDDLDRADEHGDLDEGSPLALVAAKLRAGFDKYGLRKVGEKGEKFDPKIHEALVRLTSPDAQGETVADVIETGYILGERLIRAAKVAVSVPE